MFFENGRHFLRGELSSVLFLGEFAHYKLSIFLKEEVSKMAKDKAMKIIEELETKYGGLQKLGLVGFGVMSWEDYVLYAEAQRAIFA